MYLDGDNIYIYLQDTNIKQCFVKKWRTVNHVKRITISIDLVNEFVNYEMKCLPLKVKNVHNIVWSVSDACLTVCDNRIVALSWLTQLWFSQITWKTNRVIITDLRFFKQAYIMKSNRLWYYRLQKIRELITLTYRACVMKWNKLFGGGSVAVTNAQHPLRHTPSHIDCKTDCKAVHDFLQTM